MEKKNCAICEERPITEHTPCACEVLTCSQCVPKTIPGPDGLADAFGYCTDRVCAYVEYAKSLMCANCKKEPADYRFSCPCGELICKNCVPEPFLDVEELTEEYGPCTGEYCAYMTYMEEKRIESIMESFAEQRQTNPVVQQQLESYANNALWTGLPDCHCADLSACQCDVNGI